jgi:hypothetical protein
VVWREGQLACWALFLVPAMGLAQCGEAPAVQMDERTAASHLLAKKDLVLPERMPEQFRIAKVILIVTVDREGTICDVKARSGPRDLRQTAVQTVKDHWRYRRFLVNWKPVVAQFPVTVKFLLPREQPRQTAQKEGANRAVAALQTA